MLERKSPQNILVVNNRALGDSLMGLSSLTYIKTLFPNINITYALPSWIIPLYSQTKTPADDFISLELKTLGGWYSLFRQLKGRNFDLIIELHQAGRTSTFFKLFSLFSQIPYFFHNHNQPSGQFIFNQGQIRPAIQKDLDACWSILKTFCQDDSLPYPRYLDFPPKIQPETDTTSDAKIIVLGMVASRRTKIWPLPFFKELCQKILQWNDGYLFLIPLSDSPLDLLLEKEILNLNFPPQVKVIKAPLAEIPLIFKQCSFYIGNDTGLKHLFVALDKPTITFFGPEGPLEWHPYDPSLHPYFYIENLPCRTRTAHFCGLNTCDSMICLNQIPPDRVFDKFLSLA